MSTKTELEVTLSITMEGYIDPDSAKDVIARFFGWRSFNHMESKALKKSMEDNILTIYLENYTEPENYDQHI